MLRSRLRVWLILAVVVIVGTASAIYLRLAPPNRDGPVLAGHMQNFALAVEARPAPQVSWRDEQGRAVALEDFGGKVVLLNFWATWCAPCVRELPSINALQDRLGGETFTVVALNIDRDGETAARRMSDRLKLDRLAVYIDPENAVPRALSLKIMPTTVLYDRHGRELGRLEGAAEWNAPEAVGLVEYFIEHPEHADSL